MGSWPGVGPATAWGFRGPSGLATTILQFTDYVSGIRINTRLLLLSVRVTVCLSVDV